MNVAQRNAVMMRNTGITADVVPVGMLPLVAQPDMPARAGMLVDAFLPDETADIFNRAAFHQLHRPRFASGTFLQWRGANGRFCGAFHALEEAPGHFSSPGRGSFGGFDVADGLGCSEIATMVGEAEQHLRDLGARRLSLVLPPLCYAPDRAALVLHALLGLGYVVERHELNQAIALRHAQITTLGTYANRKRLNKTLREGVSTALLPPEAHAEAHAVLVEARRKKGYTLSMSWNDVAEMRAAFPQALRVFGAWHGGAMVAAAICVVVNPSLLYVYAWGELPGAERLSPVTALAAALYRHARQEGFTQLDLGTSSLHGAVNPGLFAFKRSLGATPSPKLFLSKTLSWRS